MKQSTIVKYKLLFVLILFIFLLIFSIYTFNERINNESMSSNIKPINQPIIPRETSVPQPSIAQPSVPQPSIAQPSVPQPSVPQPSINQPTISQPILSSLILDSTIADGNYIIMSDHFKSALSVYPSPAHCDGLNEKRKIFAITADFSVTDIWTVKTINNKTTIQQNNCNYLQLNTIEGELITILNDRNTQILEINDNSANIFYWKINKNQEDNTYSLVPYDNQGINLYNVTINGPKMELNFFISNNNNNINNKIAKFIFNKIS